MMSGLRQRLIELLDHPSIAGKLDTLLLMLGGLIIVTNVLVALSLNNIYSRNATLNDLAEFEQRLVEMNAAQQRFRLLHERDDATRTSELANRIQRMLERLPGALFVTTSGTADVASRVGQFLARFNEYLLYHEQSGALDSRLRKEIAEFMEELEGLRHVHMNGQSGSVQILIEAALRVRITQQDFSLTQQEGLAAARMFEHLTIIRRTADTLRQRSADVDVQLHAYRLKQHARQIDEAFRKLRYYSSKAALNEQQTAAVAHALLEQVGQVMARQRTAIEREIHGIVASLTILTLVLLCSFWLSASFYRRKIRQDELYLNRMATVDVLTGLNNRRQFQRTADQLLARIRRQPIPCALAVGDIDHFKRINDTYGHEVGDEVLKHLTRILAAECREADELARWGGEEFVLLMPDADQAAALGALERIRTAIERIPFAYESGTLHLTISFGVTQLRDGDTLSSAFDRADKALYQSKSQGRNRVSPCD